MAFKLDLKDRRLLFELDINARISTTALAKKAGLSQPSCHYRLNRLINKGTIKFFLTNIDYGFFGYFPYRFFCRLQNLSEEKEKEMIEYLKKHEFIPFLASCIGGFDLMFCVMAKNMSSLKETLSEIKNRYGEHFSEQEIATLVSGKFYARKYLLGQREKGSLHEKAFGTHSQQAKLDEKDLLILKAVSNNCRVSSVQLAKKAKISLDAARHRLKRLENAGIINGYTIYLNNPFLGQLRYKIMFRLRGCTEKKENALIASARSFPQTVYSVKSFGAWDLEIDLETQNAEQFTKILREIKNKNSSIIKEYQTIQLTNVYKYNHLPMNVENVLGN